MLIIRPFGMSADIAARIVQATDNDEDMFAEEWCEAGEGDTHTKLLHKLVVYRTPGEIASFSRGWHDAVLRQRPFAFYNYLGVLIDTSTPDPFTREPPRGWDPKSYIEGYDRASDFGVQDEADDYLKVSHYRITTADGGNGCLYIKEMSFDRRKGEFFRWDKMIDYMSDLAPNAIENCHVDHLLGRTIDEVLVIPWPGGTKDHDVGMMRIKQR